MGGGMGGGMQIQCSCMRFSKTNKGIKKQVLHFLGELIKQYELKMTKAERVCRGSYINLIRDSLRPHL